MYTYTYIRISAQDEFPHVYREFPLVYRLCIVSILMCLIDSASFRLYPCTDIHTNTHTQMHTLEPPMFGDAHHVFPHTSILLHAHKSLRLPTPQEHADVYTHKYPPPRTQEYPPPRTYVAQLHL